MRKVDDKNPKLLQNLNERIERIGHEERGQEKKYACPEDDSKSEADHTFMYIYYLQGSLGARVSCCRRVIHSVMSSFP